MTTTVLVFPGGTEIGLEVNRALSSVRDLRLLGAGQRGPGHGPFVFREWFDVASLYEPTWLNELEAVIAAERVDFVFPAHDEAVVGLARARPELAAEVITSSVETCEIARSKSLTYRVLEGFVPTPHVFDERPSKDRFPVFVRPDRGQGSRGAERVDTPTQLDCWTDRHMVTWNPAPEGWVCTELLAGEEYTVDCFSDRDAGLLFVGPRERLRVQNGISVSTRSVNEPVFTHLAQEISKRVSFHGAWFFQLKRRVPGGQLVLLEVAPRIAGMMGFHRAKGVNLALLSLLEAQRTPVRILDNPGRLVADRALATRYHHDLAYRRAYIDLDDTILTSRGVDTQVIRFVFQCVNRGVEVVLLTRHRADLTTTLRRARLNGVFDRVIHVREHESKSDHIEPEAAILVDDSFAERAAAWDRHGILTFDGSMLEALLDDRT